MDFLKAGCKITHLHKDELIHELTIRNLPVNPRSRRDSLYQVLKQTADLARRGSLKFTSLGDTDLTSELEICQRKAEEIEHEINPSLTSAACARLVSRCKYLLCRLLRLGTGNEEVQLLKSMIESILKSLMERVSSVASSSGSDDEDRSSNRSSKVIREIIYKTDKSFNVNSLNLKYRGDSCVRTFLTRLEELRIARKISEDRIFSGFPEILEGPALSWFRSNRADFSSYSDVASALKEDFYITDLVYSE